MVRTFLLMALLCVAMCLSVAEEDNSHAQALDARPVHRRGLAQFSFEPFVVIVGAPAPTSDFDFASASAPGPESIAIFAEETLPAEATDPDAECDRCPEDTCSRCRCATGVCILPEGTFGIFGGSPVSAAICSSCQPRSQCEKHFWFCKRSGRG